MMFGGGLRVGAYGGGRELMSQMAPVGPVYQAGTLSRNPLAMAAGIATLTALTEDVHDVMASRTRALVEGLRGIAARRGVPFTADSAGSMFGFFFRAEPVRSYADARTSDVELFRKFFHAALARGVYLAPSPYEAGFTSAAHGDAEIAATLERLDAALADARG
jgi:glutamate-1-semialdehyde 2,1-aminomutase